ncbi:MAG: glycosyltransferase [Clostridia bacterium]|nr:glycosyltransferase [Clostridia bacterium]
MSVVSSVRSFLRRVRHDGVRAIPGMVHTRWMTFIHRDVLRREAAERRAQEAAYQAWLHAHEVPDAAPFHTDKHLSFLIPTYNTRPEHLNALADSLLAQSCPNWEACLYDGASPHANTRAALAALAERDPRFRVMLGTSNEGISGNTNRAFVMATGDVIALCDHDDLLAPDAVRCILQAADAGADLIYTDEDKVTGDGMHFYDPHVKGDFAPDSLRSGNYICHLTALSRELMLSVGGLRSACDGSQDHDLVLRASERARKIVHIPRILYHWRMLDTSFSHQRAASCVQAACDAVADQLQRRGMNAQVTMEELRVRIRYAPPKGTVSAIVTGKGAVPRLPGEVIRIDNPAQANDAARRAAGEYLLFLQAGMKPLDQAWLNELLMYAQRADVGCVGSAILDSRRFYRHAGYAVDVPGGAVSHHAGQWLYGNPYQLTDRIVRNVTGLSAALMLVRREVFLSLGGFGAYESDLRGADFGLRCLKAGYINVYTPHARMVCRDEAPCLTSEAPQSDLDAFSAAWGEHPVERYYSPLFTRDGRMTIDTSPKEAAK